MARDRGLPVLGRRDPRRARRCRHDHSGGPSGRGVGALGLSLVGLIDLAGGSHADLICLRACARGPVLRRLAAHGTPTGSDRRCPARWPSRGPAFRSCRWQGWSTAVSNRRLTRRWCEPVLAAGRLAWPMVVVDLLRRVARRWTLRSGRRRCCWRWAAARAPGSAGPRGAGRLGSSRPGSVVGRRADQRGAEPGVVVTAGGACHAGRAAVGVDPGRHGRACRRGRGRRSAAGSPGPSGGPRDAGAGQPDRAVPRADRLT
jgi:hypothetical protein